MIRITYAKSGNLDLASIKNYYTNISEQTYQSVMSDIRKTLGALKVFPDMGRNREDGTRRFPTTKYKFNIVYERYTDEVRIIAIYRYQNRT